MRLRAIAFGAACLAVLAASAAARAAATPCQMPIGGRIVLESDAVDPDVFLWDSRPRLIDYAAGEWSNTRSIFAHTLLAEPGTAATVVACVPGAAHPKFGDGIEDAVGVKIATGPYKGRYGWVLSSDIHPKTGVPGGALVNNSKDVKR